MDATLLLSGTTCSTLHSPKPSRVWRIFNTIGHVGESKDGLRKASLRIADDDSKMILFNRKLRIDSIDHKRDQRSASSGVETLEKALLLWRRVIPAGLRTIQAPPLLTEQFNYEAPTFHLIQSSGGLVQTVGHETRGVSDRGGTCSSRQIWASMMALSKILAGSSLLYSKQKTFLAFHICHKSQGETSPASGNSVFILLHFIRW